MRRSDEPPHNDPERTTTLEQLRVRRRNLAGRIQSLLSELESAEREFDSVSKELERLSHDPRH